MRRLIRDALDDRRLGAEQGASRWMIIAHGQSELRPAEAALAGRLLGA